MAKRQGIQFGLRHYLIAMTAIGVLIGLRLRVPLEQRAITELRASNLRDIWYHWQEPQFVTYVPPGDQSIRGWTTDKNGVRKELPMAYQDATHQIVPSSIIKPTPDLIERWLKREPRTYVFAVHLWQQNLSDKDIVRRLKQLSRLKYVIVQSEFESSEGPKNPVLESLRKELPGVTVLGEIAKYHPENEPKENEAK